jgi:hypothetical protein
LFPGVFEREAAKLPGAKFSQEGSGCVATVDFAAAAEHPALTRKTL